MLRSVTRETQDVFTRKIQPRVFSPNIELGRVTTPSYALAIRVSDLKKTRHTTIACFTLYFTLCAFVFTVAAEL